MITTWSFMQPYFRVPAVFRTADTSLIKADTTIYTADMA